ncbi:hypothetical protein TeGR_g8906 [Tetraparma gracilis]|uniref:Nuclear segregation protein Bfr1 n=1 Tax=Tetraparma gracilis TaxID=2962635 RepID=A0ABQ6MQZ9_9STRA|nr:hypothetical protein TeGR_g8906 [Tetraparma gracilis]
MSNDEQEPVKEVQEKKEEKKEEEQVGEVTKDQLTDGTRPRPRRPTLPARVRSTVGRTAKIDKITNATKDSELGAARAEFNRLKGLKQTILKERGAIFDKRDAIKEVTDKLIGDAKKSKDAVKYTSLESIEKRIRELHDRQSTTSMSLAEEKKLVKEIEELSASKKKVAAITANEDKIGASKAGAKDLQAAIAEKGKELTGINEQLDKQKVVLTALSEKEGATRSVIPDLYKERDAVYKQIKAEWNGKKKLRDDFKKDNNLWYENQKLVKQYKKQQYEAESKKRAEEKQLWLKAKEEEELKKTPYEEEMALCEYLANYLSTTYLKDDKKEAAEAEAEAKPAVKDDPFAGFAAVNKKQEDTFMKMGKGNKKERVTASAPKAKKAPKAAPFNLSVDTFDQFSLLNLTPPTSLAEVAGKVTELKEKQVWYTKQERGAVETAADIKKKQMAAAKKSEKKAEKAEEGNDGEKKEDKKKESKKSGGKFVLNNDDFAPLGGGKTVEGGGASSWGKKEEKVAEEVTA